MTNKFKHLRVPETWEQYWTRYPQGYTIMEALINWVSQVNEMSDNINDWNDYLDDFVNTWDKDLQTQVVNLLSEWKEDGTLDLIINHTVFNELNDKITQTENKLDLKADKQTVQQQLNLKADKTEVQDVQQSVARVTKRFKQRRASFCLIDDDARSEVITILKPMLDARGIKGTIAVPTGLIGQSSRLTEHQIKGLYEEGWEIMSHSHNHISYTDLTFNQIVADVEESLKWLKDRGIKVRGLAYPNGLYDANVVNAIRSRFDYAVTTGAWLNQTPLQTYAIARLGVGAWGFNTFDTMIKPRIDTIIRRRELGVIMTHIGDNTPEQNRLVEQTLDYILSLGYEIKTMSEAFDEHANLIEYGEFDSSTSMHKFAIGKDGTPGGYALGFMTAPVDTYYGEHVISDFRPEHVTINRVSSDYAWSLPTDVGGILTTYRFGSDDYGYQIFKPANSNHVYIRDWNFATESWGAWERLNSNIAIIEPNSVTPNTPASAFPNNKISYCRISTSNAEGFPTGVGGTLITNRLLGHSDYIRQEYHLAKNQGTYFRWANGDTWSNWRRYEVTTVE